jgi:hypothetical protein
MESDFICPNCRSYLNIGNNIVFSVQIGLQDKRLLLLNKTLGDYSLKKHDEIQFQSGENLNFFCPICYHNFISKIHPNLARIIMIEDDNTESEVYFSKVAGEHTTYKITNNKIEAFGKDKDKYLHLFK